MTDNGGKMKIVVTIHDAGMAANIGGSVEAQSAVIEIPEDMVPSVVSEYFKAVRFAREVNKPSYVSLSLSLLREDQSPTLKDVGNLPTEGKSEGKVWIGISHPGEELKMKLVDENDASFVKNFGSGDGAMKGDSGVELKPCPFCGEQPEIQVKDKIYDVQVVACKNVHCDFYVRPEVEDWNSAYCWKEIDRLKKERDYFEKESEFNYARFMRCKF